MTEWASRVSVGDESELPNRNNCLADVEYIVPPWRRRPPTSKTTRDRRGGTPSPSPRRSDPTPPVRASRNRQNPRNWTGKDKQLKLKSTTTLRCMQNSVYTMWASTWCWRSTL